MDHFQQRLDALQKDSKELILQGQQSIVDAVKDHQVPSQRVALALAQRFTPERIAGAFPVLCLLDALLNTQQKDAGSVVAAVLTTVTQEFWRVAPSLFEGFVRVYETQPQLKDKVLRMMRRWRQRKLLEDAVAGALLDAAEYGPRSTASTSAVEAASTDPAGGGQAEEHFFSRSQAHSFGSILRQCTALLEQLPAERAQLYMNTIQEEQMTRPNHTSLRFFQGLLTELRRERTASQLVDGEEENLLATAEETPTDNSDARAALGRLLDRLSAADVKAARSGATAVGALSETSATAVVRYNSPFFSDIFQRQSLVQRSGFGEFHKRRVTSSGDADWYYPRREVVIARPFRIPAGRQVNGGAVRLWFPSPQAWVAAKDTANLALFAGRRDTQLDRETTNVFSVARKREREGGVQDAAGK